MEDGHDKVGKKSPKVRIGTKDNPFLATPESVERPFLIAAIEGGNHADFDFSKWHETNDWFMFNSIYNTNLSHKEVRLLMFFHETTNNLGTIYETSTNGTTNVARHYGEDNFIFVEFPAATKLAENPLGYEFFFEDQECIALLTEIEKIGLKLDQKELAKMLYRLHDFGYLTVTDLIASNLKRPLKTVGEKPTSHRAKLRLVRVTNSMTHKELWNKWNSYSDKQLLQRVKELKIKTKPLSSGK
ncbi:hypothetical protein [Rheinheimera sp. 1928-s]|uniref:hypothetical protein n=1 Tax=Rheinheimera sp. 1928-s TaxID=3033803 RepID=UPI00263650F6|nr:hypothetical protein [Rheinheimera sp. 1928-s]MDF3124672.1 hypothetical protein [Rheinheimera sp. 1928-s]